MSTTGPAWADSLNETHAFARVGLLGAPSDGYHGRVLSATIDNFRATVRLAPSQDIVIRTHPKDRAEFSSVGDLIDTTSKRGYYGGTRIVQATIVSFLRHCRATGVVNRASNFAIEYDSNIPLRLGLAGSSAIAMATLRALLMHFNVSLPLYMQAQIVHSAELHELGIPSGPQDRVVQAYEGLLYMDFRRELMESRGYGEYERLDAGLLPRLFLAYEPRLSEGTEAVHLPLRDRWLKAEAGLVETMHELADTALLGRDALIAGDLETFEDLLNMSFRARARVHDVGLANARIAKAARDTCGSANLAGSGGAIVGSFRENAELDRLREVLGPAATVVECLVS